MTKTKRNEMGEHFASGRAGFFDVGAAKQLPAGTALRVTVGEDAFTLVNLDDRLLAVRDLCVCCGRSLSTATFSAGALVCRGCGWKFDLQRGCVAALPSLRIEMHDLCVEDGRLLLASAITAPASLR